MSWLKRLFGIGAAKAHKALDAIEDPIEMLELKVRELKGSFAKSMEGLAKVKALEVKYRHSAKALKVKADDYLSKANQIKARVDSGEWTLEDQKSNIVLMLNKKENMELEYSNTLKNAEAQKGKVDMLQKKIKDLQKLISGTESQIVNLKAETEAAKVNKSVSKELSSVNVDSAQAQIDEIQARINNDNAEAEAWTDIEDNMEDEEKKIERLLSESSPSSDDDLLASFMSAPKEEKKPAAKKKGNKKKTEDK